jgi:hypothetical protein
MFFTWNLAYEEIYTTYNAGPFDATAIANNKRDIADARATGIDGFLLAFINRSDQMNWAINMFEAARQLTLINPTQPPFLLFIASNAGNAGDISAWGDGQPFMYSLLRAFYNHPNYYKIGGKLVVGAFIGSTNDADWANVFTLLQNNQGVGVLYCPTLQDSSNADLGGITFNAFAQQYVGSISYWTGGGPGGDISSTNNLAAINKANKQLFAVTYS